MKKLVALLLALTMVLGAASALADVRVLWYTMGDTYLSLVRGAMEDQFAARGIKVSAHDANNNQQTQTDECMSAAMIYDGLAVNIVDSSNYGSAEAICNQIAPFGKPFVFFNRAISADESQAIELLKQYNSYFVGTASDEAGKIQGDMIGDFLLANYDAVDLNGDGVISYIMFKGDEANPEAIFRTQFAVENADAKLTAAGKPALKFYDPNNSKKYLVDRNNAWSRGDGQEFMDAALAQYSEGTGNMIELVIANNDEMAIGALQSLQSKGYNVAGGKIIPVFGVDATPDAKALIAEGLMTGTVLQDAEGMADAVVTLLCNMMEGKDAKEGLNPNYHVVEDVIINIPYQPYTGA